MQKIAMIHPNLFERGGAERKLILMSKYLVDNGYDVKIIVKDYNKETTFKEFIDEKLKIIEYKGNKIEWFKKIYNHLKENNYDLVVAHNYPANIPVAIFKMFNKNKKICWVCNEVAVLLHRRDSFAWQMYYKIEKFLNKNFDVIIANSTFTAGSIQEYYKKEPIVIRSGVEIKEDIDLTKIDKKVIEIAKKDYIFSLSRIEEHKNIKMLEKIAKNLDINILVAGKGSFIDYIKNLEKKYKNIIYLGAVNENEKFYLYKNAKIFAFLPKAEPLGVTTMEALSQNTPVVAYNNGGPKEIILDKINGFLSNNDEEYIKNLQYILTENFTLKDKDGKEYIKKKFSNERMVKDFFDVFVNIMGEKND